ncbi:hypothetical protein HYT25_03405, partial [Candidatus Pacearchaeota archaeon]|nr:hypothetical protein [Candidatus Pacearchaeota archaeon]
GAIFLITVVLVSYALGNVFKGNKSVSGSIAVAVGLLVIYGVNRSGFNYTDLFYNFFFFLPTGFIETIWPILVIGLIVICWIRYGPWKGTSIFLIWTGIFLIILSFMGVFYESSGGFGLGLLIFIAGLGMRFFNRIRFAGRKHNPESPDEHWSRWD